MIKKKIKNNSTSKKNQIDDRKIEKQNKMDYIYSVDLNSYLSGNEIKIEEIISGTGV